MKEKSTFQRLQSHDDLIKYLKNYGKNMDSFEEYDFGWMISLFLACLDNMRQYALPVEIEDFGDYLNKEQKQFLLKIAEAIQKSN